MSDGAAAHFKNRFQLHELQCSQLQTTKWLFSATGHGKNACDGVGGLVKHQATLHNLRSPATEVIQCASDFVTIVASKLKKVFLLHMEKSEVEAFRELKKEEWKLARRVQGIQATHMCKHMKSDQGNFLYVARCADTEWKEL